MTDQIHQDFIQQNPLSFGLYNYYERNDYNLLYINDNPDELRFNLEIKNLSTQAITLNKSTQSEPEAPSSNNYHIELKFRPNQLSQRSREKIDLSEVSKDGWSMSRLYENRDHTVSLFLLKRKEDLVIEKQGTKFITLVGLGANSIEGARVTQLEINYKNFHFAQDKYDENANTQRGDIDSQTQIIILTILNYSGKREANLTITFAYAPTLLNNGSDSEPIVLQIVNTGQDSITLNENSRFELTIDVQGERAEPWALAKKDEAKTYDVDIEQKPGNFLQSRESWIIEKPVESGEDPTWIIRPNFGLNQRKEERDTSRDFTLKQNEDFFIKIKNLKSSLRPGIGNLYLAYYNLPGYMDKKRTLNVTKTCITERKGVTDFDGRIGINKYPDSKTQLDVKGRIASDSLEVKGEAVANSLKVNNTVSARKFEGEGAFVTGMIMMWSGAADALPYGWALCDGTKGTPDLRGRFILSAGEGYALNQKGGSKLHNYKVEVLGHQLTEAEIPVHTHLYTIANRFDGYPSGGDDHRADEGYYWTNATNPNKWGQSSGKSTFTSSVGGNTPHNHGATIQPQESDQMPPYYVLCFIMKIGVK